MEICPKPFINVAFLDQSAPVLDQDLQPFWIKVHAPDDLTLFGPLAFCLLQHPVALLDQNTTLLDQTTGHAPDDLTLTPVALVAFSNILRTTVAGDDTLRRELRQ